MNEKEKKRKDELNMFDNNFQMTDCCLALRSSLLQAIKDKQKNRNKVNASWFICRYFFFLDESSLENI
jgi:hypothetical protein